jgi:hypothetical protein
LTNTTLKRLNVLLRTAELPSPLFLAQRMKSVRCSHPTGYF